MISHRSHEWYKIRIGKFTASNFPNLVAKPADKNAIISKSAMNCIEKAAAQLFYNRYHERPDSDATRWGINNENRAIQLFSEKTGLKVNEMGFIEHRTIKDVGATPDTQVIDSNNPEKLIIAQIKCPYNGEYHKDYLKKIVDTQSLKNKKSEYYWQIQGEMWVTGAEYSYFVSYDPRVYNEEDKLHFIKVFRDEDSIQRLETVVKHALSFRDSLLEDFKSNKKRPKPLAEYW